MEVERKVRESMIVKLIDERWQLDKIPVQLKLIIDELLGSRKVEVERIERDVTRDKVQLCNIKKLFASVSRHEASYSKRSVHDVESATKY
jgi:hypothetical protein